ncbi:hypothetical protein SUNI508_12926 [Seiridium unicorne]|uniref:Uncharacterized protein n=1 Tax=Seiridium unicorne TaxID=138068 RepID=A0ABR2VF53_9PEZI
MDEDYHTSMREALAIKLVTQSAVHLSVTGKRLDPAVHISESEQDLKIQLQQVAEMDRTESQVDPNTSSTSLESDEETDHIVSSHCHLKEHDLEFIKATVVEAVSQVSTEEKVLDCTDARIDRFISSIFERGWNSDVKPEPPLRKPKHFLDTATQVGVFRDDLLVPTFSKQAKNAGKKVVKKNLARAKGASAYATPVIKEGFMSFRFIDSNNSFVRDTDIKFSDKRKRDCDPVASLTAETRDRILKHYDEKELRYVGSWNWEVAIYRTRCYFYNRGDGRAKLEYKKVKYANTEWRKMTTRAVIWNASWLAVLGLNPNQQWRQRRPFTIVDGQDPPFWFL